MTLARLFGRNGLRIRQARPPMPQSGQPHGTADASVETVARVAELSKKHVRPGACLAALALVLTASPSPLRAQTSKSLLPDSRTQPADVLKERTKSTGCDLPLVTTGRVRSVIDGRTLMLEDGREVRLAAIEVAPLIAAAADEDEQARNAAGRAAQRALAHLTLGRDITLRQEVPSVDRYGRIVAFGFVAQDKQDKPQRSLQEDLLAQGHARLAARVEPQACLPSLRVRERDARRAALGLWADPNYSAQPANKPADIAARRGRFTVVEGDVVSVRESRGTTYINFGRRWSESFTAVILKRNAGALLAAGVDPKRLRGRRVDVRGFVELRGGPRSDVMRPEQIAVVAGR
jgi:endonuclease YncB( thermonuclease family)